MPSCTSYCRSLPLFLYMDVKVTPLAKHPSGLPEMYAYEEKAAVAG